VLTQIARSMTASSGRNELSGRYGGEEFLLVLGGATPPHALRHAEALRAAVARYPFTLPNGATIAVTISIGIAAAPAHGTHCETLLGAADDALYRAKATGRDRVRLASSATAEHSAESRAIEQRERARTATH